MLFQYPVPSTSIVTQTFAEHVHAAELHHWQNYNGGIDWAVPTGTPIVAAQAGKVKAVRRDATGYGTHVRIQHDHGYETIYGHMLDFAVKAGDQVEAGQVIGRSDNTGNSTGPHVHFELRLNGQPIDPMPLLTLNPSPASPPIPPEVDPGQIVYIQPGYNLRAGPSTEDVDLGTVDATMQAAVIKRSGDWLKVSAAFWVHIDGVQG